MPRSPLARPLSRRDRRSLRAAVALAASLALNAAAFAGLAAAGAFSLPERPAARVALAALSAQVWEANRAVAGAPAPDEPEPPPAPERATPPAAATEPERTPRGIVVQVAPSPDPRRPDRARFVADRDNTVPRDVQSRLVGRDGEAVAARRTAGGGASTQGIPESGEEGTAAESVPGAEGSAEARVAAARAALAPDTSAIAGGAARAEAQGTPPRGAGGARRTGPFDPRLLPVGAAFAQVPGGAPKDQWLPGVPEGDETRLNTRRFRFADFYARVDAAIRREWEPDREWRLRDPQDRVYGTATRVARVDIVLDLDGRLREARVVKSSGLDFYDRECLRAIRAAAPFPNPPRGLAGPDGLIVLASWGLTFTFDRGPALARPSL